MSKGMFLPREILFPEDSYKVPYWEFPGSDQEKPRYYPIIDMLVIPPMEDETFKMAIGFEKGHWMHGYMGTRVFMKILASLIYTEFYCPHREEEIELSSLTPENNLLINTLKEIYDTVLELTRYVEEIHATKLAYFALQEQGFGERASEIEQRALDQESTELPKFAETYKTYQRLEDSICPSHSISPEELITALTQFALAGPSYLPDLPLSDEGFLDSTRVTNEVSEKAVDEFADTYRQLPYSPLKRFLKGIAMVAQASQSNHQHDDQLINKSLVESDLYKKDGKQGGLPLYIRGYFPLTMINLQGLRIFQPIRAALLKIACKNSPTYRANVARTWGVSELPKSPIRHLTILRNNITQYTRSYLTYWPSSAFFIALEYLRHILFYHQKGKRLPKKITLVDKIAPLELVTMEEDKVSECKAKMHSTSHFPPFITVEVEPSQDHRSCMEIHFSY